MSLKSGKKGSLRKRRGLAQKEEVETVMYNMSMSEKGRETICWFCEVEFKKNDECEVCGFFICPSCHKCGCHLTKSERRIARICVATFLGLDYWRYWKERDQ